MLYRYCNSVILIVIGVEVYEFRIVNFVRDRSLFIMMDRYGFRDLGLDLFFLFGMMFINIMGFNNCFIEGGRVI